VQEQPPLAQRQVAQPGIRLDLVNDLAIAPQSDPQIVQVRRGGRPVLRIRDAEAQARAGARRRSRRPGYHLASLERLDLQLPAVRRRVQEDPQLETVFFSL